ncbi:MAG: Na/Pi cotransporter family protein [Saccharofermentanales bacterium]
MSDIDAKMFITLFGGLALFVYGMQQMGEGLQKVAGNKLKSILQMLTGNPLLGILVGAVVTAIIQSSSATTVIVVGFVSAGLMTLKQSIGVIMGANIGTTMTAWIVAIKIDNYAWLFVAAGFIMMFILKNPKMRYIGQIIFAFGVLFVGLNAMSASMKPLAASQEFADLLLKIKDIPVLGLVVGTALTVIVQSSSASIGVLQTLAGTAKDAAGTPLISLYQAIPILFGSNIGTTITAIFASMGTSKKEAKRAAAAHAIFNIVGSVLFMLILIPYTTLVDWIIRLTGMDLLPDIRHLMTPTAEFMRSGIAVSHTIFNITNTILWLPFIWLMVIIVKKLIPGQDPVNEKELKYVNYSVISNPSVAIDLVTKEIARMTELSSDMTNKVHDLIRGKIAKEDVDDMVEKENGLDYLENEIVRYLSTLISHNTLTDKESARIAGLMHATNDIERIGDYCMNITNSALEMTTQNIDFSDDARSELDEAFSIVKQMVTDATSALRDTDFTLAGKIMSQEDVMDELEERLRIAHLDRLNNGLCNPQSTVIYLEILHTMERISDHCKNIAEVVVMDTEYKVHRSKF